MKLAPISTLLLLTTSAPALADVIDGHPAVVGASTQDLNLDGVGDVLSDGSTVVQLGAAVEDRATLEFDITHTLLPNFTDVTILVRVQAADALALGTRQFDFVLYAGDGIPSAADFQIAGTVIDSQGFDPALNPDLWIEINVTAEVTAMIQANVTHAGLRVEASSNPSGSNVVSLLGTELYFQECFPSWGFAYCFGDGSGAVCPCGNTGAFGAGCASSTGAGATLGYSGVPQIPSTNPFALQAVGVPPNKPGMFLSGMMSVSVPVADGILCSAGSSQRFELVFSDPNGSAATSVDIATATGLVPGDQRYYQYWFRDPGGPCGGGFNFTNGLQVTWI